MKTKKHKIEKGFEKIVCSGQGNLALTGLNIFYDQRCGRVG